jgi:hypothetical protein
MTIETSASIENLATALGKFQAETHGVVKDASNPFYKNRYATLEAVIETARPALTKNGLAFVQAPAGLFADARNSIGIETMLIHATSGEWLRFGTTMPLPKVDPQGVGSAITYACRYALMAMLGLPPLDDDAEATKPQPKSHVIQALAQEQWKGEYVEGPPHKPDKVEGYHPPSGRPSKDVYIEKAIKRMDGMESAPELLQWAKDERKMVWPQYGIDPHDEDGQKLVKAYKDRMADLEELEQIEVTEGRK